MSLEKLLIFGAALAVLTALATFADDTTEKRDTQNSGYKEKVNDLAEKAR